MGLFNFFKNKSSYKVANLPQLPHQELENEEKTLPCNNTLLQAEKPKIWVPRKIDDLSLVLSYDKVKFSPSENAENIAISIQKENFWSLTIQIIDDKVKLFSKGNELGELIEKTDSVKEWISDGETLLAWLENYGESGNYIFLAYYREIKIDYERKLSSFRQDSIKLTGCTKYSVQETIGEMQKYNPVFIRRSKDKTGNSFKVYNFFDEEIGKIPEKYEECCNRKKILAAYLEDRKYSVANTFPVIKIFWDTPKDENSPVFRFVAAKSNSLSFYKKLTSYVVLDVETTGLDPVLDDIIEIGMVKIDDGEISSKYSTLVKPHAFISSAASAVNGIKDEDVKDAPRISEIIHEINDFMGDSIIVGHNVTFDLRFLRLDMLSNNISKEITYVDTLSVSRSTLPYLENHKLQTLMDAAGIRDVQSHRALDDAINTHKILQYCIEEKIKQNDAIQQKRKAQKQAEDAERAEKYSDSPLYNKHFVFTGEFRKDRYELEEMLPGVGALLRSDITKKTSHLVKGDISDLPEWALERKLYKAEDMIKNGSAIQIISEQEFLELINNAKSALS